ncbi:MAG TPA: bifunctional UDP-N-acetylmuramoyl-tripeptide:D-alanyl-D-alanine ligase/alanine racemase [Flavobacteriales bacterium]|nr:bifunctional UDP-N-acetylmuramoyl-tripeptide:D-alanyl-D-alanine ligase/alanine racemase [Flavobacteriales bacterium]
MTSAGHRLTALAEAIGGEWLARCDDPLIAHLCIDSRKPFSLHDTLFIALSGSRHDGHRYIRELHAKGMRHFIVSDPAAAQGLRDSNVIRVRDTRDALQRIAAWHRSQMHAPVVGITGSNGKTVVKEWLFHLLRDSEHIARSPGSWNSQVGVPLSVWGMRREHTLGLFEAGVSEPGEMERLRAVIHPTIGIFTNIGPAHGEHFTDDRTKASEKAVLFRDAQAVVYCADDEDVVNALHAHGIDQRAALLAWSRERQGWLHVVRTEPLPHGQRIRVFNDRVDFDFEIPFTDQASAENAIHCVALLLHLGRSPQWIAARTPTLPPVSMRLEALDGVHGITLLNDAYSNDTASLAIALEHLDALAAGRPKAVVLSDLMGGEEPALRYRRVEELLARSRVETVITVGPELREHALSFAHHVQHFADAEELLARFDPAMLKDHAVLVKGARAFGLERIATRWQRQVHGTVMEIDLEAIRHNLNHYRALLTAGTRTMAMVKAFGYGNGALELARLFAHEQVQYLGVAYADEGIELRQHGITTPILVMNPEPVPMETLHRFRLEPEVYDERSFSEAARFAEVHADAPVVHIKLDTGMRRLGFAEDELPWLIDALREAKGLRVASILSHLAASDDPAHDEFTRTQLALFRRMSDALIAALGYRPLLHIANSAGAARWKDAHFDMARLGIGLHGIGADANETAQLQHAASLRTVIAQIKRAPDGATIGYGRRGMAQGERMIATVPMGYADGLSRRLSNGVGRFWVHGQAAPIIGTVCMDMCMIDVTDITCAVGDEAVLFDAAHPITELARDLGTIPYEVLTSVPPRVKRVYVRG